MKLDHSARGKRLYYFSGKIRYVYTVKEVVYAEGAMEGLRAEITYETPQNVDDDIPISWIKEDKILDET